jgi:hypothetical protein
VKSGISFVQFNSVWWNDKVVTVPQVTAMISVRFGRKEF